jgi:hypothetical protein
MMVLILYCTLFSLNLNLICIVVDFSDFLRESSDVADRDRHLEDDLGLDEN